MEIQRFFRNGLVFAIPFAVWVGVIIAIDPFEYFNVSHGIPEPVKVANAASLNELMFSMLKEVHNPGENVIIGDSRVGSFSLEQIKGITGEEYHRLSSNALKLNEALDLFWFANGQKRLSHVVFGVNFNQYNDYAFADRVHSVDAVIHNPLLYVFDRSVAQAAYFVLKAHFTGQKAFTSIPPMTRDEFWRYIVMVRATEHYARYRHPDGSYKRMQDMVAFAKAQGTEVTFVIVPHHTDLQHRVRDFGLIDELKRFKRELSDLKVRVVDYDYESPITSDRGNFRDPLHCNDSVTRLIVNEVFGGRLVVGKLCTSSTGH